MNYLLAIYILVFFLGCDRGDAYHPTGDAPYIPYITPPNNDTNTTGSSEPYYNQQWYLAKNELFYAQNKINSEAHIHIDSMLERYTGEGVKIAVIDDGLDVTHEDLQGSIVATYDVVTKTSIVSHTTQDGHHGTAVTGIIGARINSKGIAGIAPNAQIIFLKHADSMSDAQAIELFTKAKEFGADIISCSWGTYDVSDTVKSFIVDLATNGRGGKGIPIIFATGNNNKDMGNDESSIPEVIAVGATDNENLRASYSNYGENIDIVAPGGYFDAGITTLDTMGSRGVGKNDENYIFYNEYKTFIGTSASAPIVSAVIALILEKDPTLTRVEIEQKLKDSADKIGNLPYVDGRNNYYGYGKLNVGRVLN